MGHSVLTKKKNKIEKIEDDIYPSELKIDPRKTGKKSERKIIRDS